MTIFLQQVSSLEKIAISKCSDKLLHDLGSLVGALAVKHPLSLLSGSLHLHNMGLIARKSVIGFANKSDSKLPAQLQGLARMLKFCMHQGIKAFRLSRVNKKGTDQTVGMCRLVCAFVVCMQDGLNGVPLKSLISKIWAPKSLSVKLRPKNC